MSKKDRRPGPREGTLHAAPGAPDAPTDALGSEAAAPAAELGAASSDVTAATTGEPARAEAADGDDDASDVKQEDAGEQPASDSASVPRAHRSADAREPESFEPEGPAAELGAAAPLEHELETQMAARRTAALIDSARQELIAGGMTEQAAEAVLRSKLDPLGDEAARRVHGRRELLASVAAWFEGASAAAVAEVLADAKKPKGPPVPPHHVRCRLRTAVSGWGYTLDGHRREHWHLGEIGDFKLLVVESAPDAFERLG